MFNSNKIKVEFEVKYEYDSQLDAIKEIIKQIIELKNIEYLEVKEEK